MDYFGFTAWLAVGLALAGASVAWFRHQRRAKASLQKEIERLRVEIARSETQIREQARVAAKLRSEQLSQTSLSRALPVFLRELNRTDLEPQEIPKHLFDLAEKIFKPKQMLLFLVRSPGEEAENVPEIYLRDQRGLGEIPAEATRVRLGEGKVGWVAKFKVEMTEEDWLNPSWTGGLTIADNHPSFRLTLVGPLVHHRENKDHLNGVFCIGEPAVRPKDEKLVLQMITDLGSIAYRNHRYMRALREQADRDGLTGLLNRRHFMKELGDLIFSAERRAQSFAVFMFDIDNFKRYNDSNGHQAGDEVLRGVAEVLRNHLRPFDLACRYGGEEFLVAMPLTDGPRALRAAERIREAIADHPFARRETQPDGMITISGGVAVFPVDGDCGTDLIRHADQGLYEAKAAGRNRVILQKTWELGDSREAETSPPNEPQARDARLTT